MDITINKERFSSADVEIYMLGRVVPGVREINYKEKQDVTPVKVVGNRKDVGYVRGNYGVEGDITLLEEEILGIERANSNRSILNLQLNITVTMTRNGLLTKETIVGVIFKERGKAVSGSSTDALMFQIPFYASDLKRTI